jgi:hypothetical protein
MQQIADLKNWLSHSMPFASTKDILVKAIQELAERKNPTKSIQKKESVKTGTAIATAVRSRQHDGPHKINNQPNVGSQFRIFSFCVGPTIKTKAQLSHKAGN